MSRAIGLSALVVLLLAHVAVAQPPAFPADFVARLAESSEIYVGTQRKDGSRSSVVPVWFAYIDGAIWFASKPSSRKVKRIEKGSPLYVSATAADGPFIETKAEIVKDAGVADRLGAIYAQKYWLAWIGYQRPSAARLEAGEIVLLKLTPL
jgi:hypothetical protein